MKLYTYFLTGTEVNEQFNGKPVWFEFLITKYVILVRMWRFQLVLRKKQ